MTRWAAASTVWFASFVGEICVISDMALQRWITPPAAAARGGTTRMDITRDIDRIIGVSPWRLPPPVTPSRHGRQVGG